VNIRGINIWRFFYKNEKNIFLLLVSEKEKVRELEFRESLILLCREIFRNRRIRNKDTFYCTLQRQNNESLPLVLSCERTSNDVPDVRDLFRHKKGNIALCHGKNNSYTRMYFYKKICFSVSLMSLTQYQRRQADASIKVICFFFLCLNNSQPCFCALEQNLFLKTKIKFSNRFRCFK
jgi:hypothetical protein